MFFALFDFLTTSTGLFARALIPNLDKPVNAFPLLAEKILSPGLKGIFYVAMFATIISTLNSFLFLSATTIARDFIFKIKKNAKEEKVKNYTVLGIIFSGIISIVIAYAIPSVVEIWYTIGSLFIPGIILPVISAYYQKFRISSNLVMFEIVAALGLSTTWIYVREFQTGILSEIEPMLIGLLTAFVIHSIGLFRKSFSFN
jgi:SSS family solute:Na+ symporter